MNVNLNCSFRALKLLMYFTYLVY